MPIKLQITVTREILEKTRNCSPVDLSKNCAIAMAIRDIWPKAAVEEGFFSPFGPNDGNAISLPAKVSKFIQHFDVADPEERANMDEITFKIKVPNYIIEKINIDEIKPLLKNHPTLKIV